MIVTLHINNDWKFEIIQIFFKWVSRYTMTVEEKGTRFLEKIYFGEENNVTVFRVSAHNNVNVADF